MRFLLFLLLPLPLFGEVKVGIDLLFDPPYFHLLQGKKIGLVSNHAAINSHLETSFEALKKHQKDLYQLSVVFSPEHGFYGDGYADEKISDHELEEIPLLSLHGERRRPPAEVLKNIDLLIFDIQDVGSRSYTYITTLFYCMEEAAKAHIPVIVLDRPNPLGGMIVDGPLLEEKWRSFLGYINIPYCHGMTIGELALLFNAEYNVQADLTVVPMKGWRREMTFQDTSLIWIPTSPQIPEADTPFFYSTTGLIGHCSLTSIGIGYTLPFKVIGAPWIDGEKLAKTLNNQNLPGVHFRPFYFRPFFGKFKLEKCQGVRILITNPHSFLPITSQYTILGVLKNLYPTHFAEAIEKLKTSKSKCAVFNQLNGSEEILRILSQEPYFIWKLREICAQSRTTFLPIRKKYLLYS